MVKILAICAWGFLLFLHVFFDVWHALVMYESEPLVCCVQSSVDLISFDKLNLDMTLAPEFTF